MKVLWFSVTPSLYCESNSGHNGGGWIASLEKIVHKKNDIQLAIAFEHHDNLESIEKDGVKYYPLNPYNSGFAKLKRNYLFETEEKLLIPCCLKVIEDFKPDIIQVFGSEWCFGLVKQYTEIPVVIHMQGSIPPYYNALYPPGYSFLDYLFYYKFNFKKIKNLIKFDRFFAKRAEREIRILKNSKYFMGRTEWDKNITRIYSPHSKYFYCSEVLRDDFFSKKPWQPHNSCNITIISVLSVPLYKGFDTILKTAQLLKNELNLSFEWRIFGVKEIKYHEWKTNIKARDVNVRLCGTSSAEKLSTELLNADIFLHTSYIDNSPNSICEAQLLGLPIIATNVGGISSLIRHFENGLLAPANDPFTIASYVKLLSLDKQLAINLGSNARNIALQRHNNQKIFEDLLNIYKQIISNENADEKENEKIN